MPDVVANGTRLYYELSGIGEPLVLVHGSWADATVWQPVVSGLSEHFRVLTYDRRGHSRSERHDRPGSVDEDGDDLAALLIALDLAPAHVAANSYGGNIALRLAARQPELFRSVSCHEPTLWSVLDDDAAARLLGQDAQVVAEVGKRIAAGDHEGAARQFVDEVIFQQGAWDDALPAETKTIMVQNAPTFLDELHDPIGNSIDRDAAASLKMPVRFTQGTASPPAMAPVIDRLLELIPSATRETLDGVGHVPQLTAPERYVTATTRGLTAIKLRAPESPVLAGGPSRDRPSRR
ncbi:MAG TPA: alpha/beta hydrolase [Jiangellaceae bacterium]